MMNLLSNLLGSQPAPRPPAAISAGGEVLRSVNIEPLKRELKSACTSLRAIQDAGVPDAQAAEQQQPYIVALNSFIAQRGFTPDHFELALRGIVQHESHFPVWMNHFRDMGLAILTQNIPLTAAVVPVAQNDPTTTLQPTPMAQPDNVWGGAPAQVVSRPQPPEAKPVAKVNNPQSTMSQLQQATQPRPTPVAQAQITKTAPSAVVQSPADDLACHPDFYNDEVAIAEMANSALTTHCSQLIFGDRKTGRTSLVKILLSLMFSKQQNLSCRIVTTQTENFLGLQASTNVVHYATGAAGDMISKAVTPIDEVYNCMVRRLQAQEGRLVQSKRPKKYAPFVLVLDCWSILYDNWRSLSAPDRKKFNASDLVAKLKAIIQQGSTVGIMAIVCGCSHSAGELGLTGATIASMALTATCLTSNQTGGVVAFQKLISDKNFLTDSSRKALRRLLSKGLQLNTGLIVTLSGVPRMFFYGDFSEVVDRQQVNYAGLLAEQE